MNELNKDLGPETGLEDLNYDPGCGKAEDNS